MSDLEKSLTAFRITAEAVYGNNESVSDWQREANPWTVTLKRGRKRLTVPFWTGSALTAEPDAADVLSCLISDVITGECEFETFCGDFGYDPDSRKAEATWQACRKLAPKVRAFLGEHFEALRQLEH